MQRNQAVELLRILSALGIVWYHAGIWGAPVAYAGLVVFIVLSPLFEAMRADGKQRSVQILARRLLVPWVIWTVIYGAFNVVRGKPMFPLDNGWIAGVLIGSGQHLWFLPFMFVFLCAIVLLRRRISKASLARVAVVGFAFMLLTMVWWRPWSMNVGYPIAQYMHALLPAFVGAAVGALGYPLTGGRIVSLVFVGTVITLFLPVSGGLAYVVGVAAVLLALQPRIWNLFKGVDFGPVAGATFGIYLMHLMALSAVFPLIRRGFEIPAVLLAFVVCAAVVMTAKKVAPRMAAIVFG
jgi:peptidoglycan/LPS O-acetylase OafA/YrhL